MEVPEHLRYTRDHEWVSLDGATATVGVTAFAADQLGDVVYLDLPEVGAAVTAGEPCGEIESTKSVSDVYAPLSGVVVEVNVAALADPSSLNTDPYGAGWLMRVELAGEPGRLLDAAGYVALLGGQ